MFVDRIGMTLVYDPIIKAAANLRPSGQAGLPAQHCCR
jgi:hypothetical protein